MYSCSLFDANVGFDSGGALKLFDFGMAIVWKANCPENHVFYTRGVALFNTWLQKLQWNRVMA